MRKDYTGLKLTPHEYRVFNIIQVNSPRPITVKEITSALNTMKRTTILTYLSDLKISGLIFRVHKGLYGSRYPHLRVVEKREYLKVGKPQKYYAIIKSD